jgi:hypothetical protein
VNLLFLQGLCVIVYTIYWKPFEEPTMNRLEVFNELCILSLAYPSLLFTDFSSDASPDFLYSLGWFMIGVIVLNLATNILVVFTHAILGLLVLYRKLKFKLLVRQTLKKVITRRLSMKILPA